MFQILPYVNREGDTNPTQSQNQPHLSIVMSLESTVFPGAAPTDPDGCCCCPCSNGNDVPPPLRQRAPMNGRRCTGKLPSGG